MTQCCMHYNLKLCIFQYSVGNINVTGQALNTSYQPLYTSLNNWHV
jgi:hypothetical protein